MTRLPNPSPGREAAERFVAEYLGDLVGDAVRGSDRFHGGQRAATAALESFEVAGYAANRNEVYPQPRRGSSGLSVYIRYGLLSLPEVWTHVEGGPEADVLKFHNELLFQEYARHWYARLGTRSRSGVRHTLPADSAHDASAARPFDRGLACLELSLDELEDDGWLVNQSRMWLASHWSVRQGVRWRDGEDFFFQHLLDGSRAANRLGWQWTSGASSAQAYGFSRWQVEERAPGLCASCDRVHDCPIEDWPDQPALRSVETPVELRGVASPRTTVGPDAPLLGGSPDVVWLTAESLGDADPALAAYPELPAVFVFDQPLLHRLQLSSKRLVFLVETLAELATQRDLELHLAAPVAALEGRKVAVTHAPVPGFVSRAAKIRPVATYPWPWLRTPNTGDVGSFSLWLKSLG